MSLASHRGRPNACGCGCGGFNETKPTLQDEDEEQGTLKFGKQKEQASYGGMDEEEKAIWKVRYGAKFPFLVSSARLPTGGFQPVP